MSMRQLARTAALRLPALTRLVDQRDALARERDALLAQRRSLRRRLRRARSTGPGARTPGKGIGRVATLDLHQTAFPTTDAGFEVFAGAWSSVVPGLDLGGHAALFGDPKIEWLGKACGGFDGKRILELGPLEGGHTCMMAQAGAAAITSIESNSAAFLKCLVTRNHFGFDARFLLGDFRPFLADPPETYDFLLASGVLYHLSDPVTALQDMARASRSLGIWTHYYDADAIAGTPQRAGKFAEEPTVQEVGGRRVVSYEQRYTTTLNWAGFAGGTEATSRWLTRESLLGVLEDLGFRVEVGEDQQDHPHGPCILLYAER